MIVDTMSKQEVMDYIRKEYYATILPYFRSHQKLYEAKIFPICQRGKRKKVTLPWVTVQSKDRTMFHLQVYGTKNYIDWITVAEFDWQGQHCFTYIKHGLLIVFSEHALRRYEERAVGVVLDKTTELKESFKVLLEYMPFTYRTILPSPTHPLCYYFVLLGGLFLGDFDETAYKPDQKEGQIWLNTCISLKESGETQKGILKTMSLMPHFINFIGFNPFDSDVLCNKAYRVNPEMKEWSSVICLSKSVYLINKLFLMMDLPVSKPIIDCVYTEMRYAESLLNMGGIDVTKLTPYGKDGIAIKGEIDYKGDAKK